MAAKKTSKHVVARDIQPATGLWRLYSPGKAPHAFKARNLATARKWQQVTRRALARQTGLHRLEQAPLQVETLGRVDKGDYVREKLLIRTGPAALMPVYMLIPKKQDRPLPVVLALHGHGYGVNDIVGLWEDGSERDTPDGYHKDFGIALCRSGFAVAAPEISCFGERQTDFNYLRTGAGSPIPTTCVHSAALAFHLGISVAGLRIHDCKRLVDYLETRKDLDTKRLGAMGISGGGFHTMYSACLDTRIKAAVISGYFCTFKDSILAMDHCPCNYVPGLADFGEMHDLAGMLAPRPILIEAASRDPIFPIAAVRKSVSKARGIFDVFGAKENLQTDYFEGRHEISGRKAYPFLQKQLGLV
jgi:dienelactone hydrolase